MIFIGCVTLMASRWLWKNVHAYRFDSWFEKANIEGSIYEYIEEDLGLKIQSGHRRVSVRKATEIEQQYLELDSGDPVAVAEQIAYFDTGIAFEYSISVHRYDSFSVEFVLTRE